MGYYTTYVLNVDTLDLTAQEKESLERKIGPFGFDGDLEWGFTLYDKWYDHDVDMCALSKEFPKAIFCLYGRGESDDDLWCSYYMDGEVQTSGAEIVYERVPLGDLYDERLRAQNCRDNSEDKDSESPENLETILE